MQSTTKSVIVCLKLMCLFCERWFQKEKEVDVSKHRELPEKLSWYWLSWNFEPWIRETVYSLWKGRCYKVQSVSRDVVMARPELDVLFKLREGQHVYVFCIICREEKSFLWHLGAYYIVRKSKHTQSMYIFLRNSVAFTPWLQEDKDLKALFIQDLLQAMKPRAGLHFVKEWVFRSDRKTLCIDTKWEYKVRCCSLHGW